MPLDASGKMHEREVVIPKGIRDQDDPPVCHLCTQEMTRAPIGWVSLTNNGSQSGQVECIACTACTRIREGGPPVWTLVEQPSLKEIRCLTGGARTGGTVEGLWSAVLPGVAASHALCIGHTPSRSLKQQRSQDQQRGIRRQEP